MFIVIEISVALIIIIEIPPNWKKTSQLSQLYLHRFNAHESDYTFQASL